MDFNFKMRISKRTIDRLLYAAAVLLTVVSTVRNVNDLIERGKADPLHIGMTVLFELLFLALITILAWPHYMRWLTGPIDRLLLRRKDIPVSEDDQD